MKVVGRTEDGKDVLKGVFYLHNTHGFTLDMSIPMILEQGLMPDWLDIYRSALSQGISWKRLRGILDVAISDSGNIELKDRVLYVLDKVDNVRNKHDKKI